MKPNFSIDYSILNIGTDNRVVFVVIEDNQTGEVFTGQATCSPNDKFDLSLGVEIAEKRAVRKMVTTSIDDELNALTIWKFPKGNFFNGPKLSLLNFSVCGSVWFKLSKINFLKLESRLVEVNLT